MMHHKLAAGAPFPEITVPQIGGGTLTLGQPRNGHDWQLVVVYRSKHCPVCTTYIKKLDGLTERLHGLGIGVIAVSADSLDRVEPHVAGMGVSVPIGYDLSVDQMKQLGVYISHPRSDKESPRPFSEPGIFVINAGGKLQVTDISNGQFVRPDLETLTGGLGFIRNPDNNYPIRGTLS